MPKFNNLNDETAQQHMGATYQFSAANIDDLGSTEYTLVTLLVDVSSSVYDFKDELERMLQTVVEACKHSPRVDNLMLRVLLFNSDLNELHGFKLFGTINVGDYDGAIDPGGMTALFDAAVAGIEATGVYGKQLVENDFDANAIVFLVTDGWNTAGAHMAHHVAEAAGAIRKEESLESLKTILIGVNLDAYRDSLEQFATDGQFDQFIDAGDATPEVLAKLADFISKSISSQSQALGTGGPSANLTF